jgi:hypothetical protein
MFEYARTTQRKKRQGRTGWWNKMGRNSSLALLEYYNTAALQLVREVVGTVAMVIQTTNCILSTSHELNQMANIIINWMKPIPQAINISNEYQIRQNLFLMIQCTKITIAFIRKS